jgi:hypothetical protein
MIDSASATIQQGVASLTGTAGDQASLPVISLPSSLHALATLVLPTQANPFYLGQRGPNQSQRRC